MMTDPIRFNPAQTVQPNQAVRPQAANPTANPAVAGSNFADVLQQTQDLKFSNHAQKRLQTRNITLDNQDVQRLSDAVDKAEKKGGKSSLVLVDNLAFIVNVKDRMVVTAMDANNRGEGVFTQIDSVVFADPATAALNTTVVDKKS